MLQDTIQQFDVEEFRDSLKQANPKELAFLFLDDYKKDSIKSALRKEFIVNDMLFSENLLAQFWGNYALAHLNHEELNSDKAISYTDKMYEVALKLNNDDLILSALINKANFYFEFGNYQESMEYNLKASELLKKTDNIVRELAVTYNIALIKLHTNDDIGAIELLKKMIAIIDGGSAGKLDRLRACAYNGLIKGYIGIEDYEKAKMYCEIAIEFSQENKDRESEFYALSFLATIARIDKNYQKAYQLLDECLLIAEEIKAVAQELPMIYFEKGEVYYDEKRYKEAIDITLKAEALMDQNNIKYIQLEEMYALLAKSYSEIEDIENSVKFYKKANEAYKKNDKRQGSISVDIIKKYDLKSLEEELNLAEKITKKTQIILYISLILALLVIGSLVYFYKKREKENQQKFISLLKSLEEENDQSKIIVQEIPKQEIVKAAVAKEKVVVKEKETTSKEVVIIDETKERLLKKLHDFEAKKLYLSKNSSLNEVAKKLKTNTSYLSKLVNAHKGKSFTAYITDLRVNYAIRRLKEDKKFRSYTIDSIAREIGFNRSESFSRAFKNKTGLYPSYYIKNLDNQNVI
jgi:AraC-like DNA-binding protein